MKNKVLSVLLSIVLVLTMGTFAYAAETSGTPNIVFAASNTLVTPEKTFTVSISATEAIEGVYSVSPLIMFDKNILEVTNLRWCSLINSFPSEIDEANASGMFTTSYGDILSGEQLNIAAGEVFVEATFKVKEGIEDGTVTTLETKAEFADEYAKPVRSVVLNKALIDITVDSNADGKPIISTESLQNGKKGAAYRQKLEATGDAPIEWTISSGNLPDGLTLSKDGIISGTPTAAGSKSFTVAAANECGTATRDFTISIADAGSSGGGGGGGGGGGTTTSATQVPTVEAGEGVKVTLNADGTTATITVEDGYEIAEVVLNGTSKGKVTEVKGLKTGDKLVVTATKKEGYLTPEEQKKVDTITGFKLAAKSKQVKLKSGKRAIRITWNTSEYQFDGVEVWRSMKKNSGYGKKPMWTIKAKNTKYYYNTAIKKGKTYYYKIRGYVEVNGTKYYTAFSNKVYRTIK